MQSLQNSSQLSAFWGKYDAVSTRWLPLAAHCLDVALVFRALCDLNGLKRMLDYACRATLNEQQLDRLAVFAMLHDLGKANLGFQNKVFSKKAPRAGHIKELRPLLDGDDIELGEAFLRTIPENMYSWVPDDDKTFASYIVAAVSHHGEPLQISGSQIGHYWTARKYWWRPQGSLDPMSAIGDIFNWAQRAFPQAFNTGGTLLPARPQFHHRFAGMVMLADWLGSDQNRFPIEPVQLEARLASGKEAIPGYLQAVGLDVEPSRNVLSYAQDFKGRFGLEPRPLQAAIDVLNPDEANTRLVIAESETGSGKTEAAFNWFIKLFKAGKVDSLYFALPTRVAARELYQRIHKYIETFFPDPLVRPVTVLAVPGYSQVDGKAVYSFLPDEKNSVRWQDEQVLQQRERQWAAERPKRYLAATIAVGTIDQALMSTIQIPHSHLRSVCLDRSLLVVDEVHASDIYMSKLLESLLSHHLSVGGSAILLSATLGAQARQQFINASSGVKTAPPDLTAAKDTPYPAITLADGKSRVTSGVPQFAKQVHFEELPLAFRLEGIVDHLVNALKAGARVVAVMNTVQRAVTLLRMLEDHPSVDHEWLFTCNKVICPHHGRFSPKDRGVLDAQISVRLGPDSPTGPVLLVGTQTLEQSLDIDADLMISDLAPADVLLQRVGRLHRHKRTRPCGFRKPRCLVLVPEGNLDDALDGGGEVRSEYKQIGYGSVYEDLRMLELTRRVLGSKPLVTIPDDNRELVEAVTHPEMLNTLKGDRWIHHGNTIYGSYVAGKITAELALSDYGQYFGDFQFNELGGKVATRLGAGTLQLGLDRSFRSPFGQEIDEIIIPGHLAPDTPGESIIVESTQDGIAILRCAEKRYSYSRYGLEAIE